MSEVRICPAPEFFFFATGAQPHDAILRPLPRWLRYSHKAQSRSWLWRLHL
jgi:hypothetical protein